MGEDHESQIAGSFCGGKVFMYKAHLKPQVHFPEPKNVFGAGLVRHNSSSLQSVYLWQLA